jgi:putrescine transport system substrate-binding protein
MALGKTRWNGVRRLRATPLGLAALLGACVCLSACSGSTDTPASKAPAQRTVRVLGWSDFLAPDVIPRFERETGIRVIYDVVDSNAMMDAKLMAGHSGYDVAFPAPSFVSRQVPAGVYQPLDKTLLPNLVHVDAEQLRQFAEYDPGNRHAMPMAWMNYGIAIDAEKAHARLPGTPLDSWSLVFDPVQARKLADCGIAMYDSPHFVMQLVYLWLGLDARSEKAEDLDRVEAALRAIRPHIRKIDTSASVSDLASGEVCLSVALSTDMVIARDRARAAQQPYRFEFVIPREGTILAGDVVAITANAKAVPEAHAFINFLLDPAIAAANTNAVGMQNAVPASRALLRPELVNDPILYPPPEIAARYRLDRMPSAEAERARNRVWIRFVANDYD